MNLLKMTTMFLILTLIASCSTVNNSPALSSQKLSQNSEQSLVHIAAPKIPFDPETAFYKLRRSKADPSKIVPTYQWKECVKSFMVCWKWESKRVELPDLEWFHAQGMGIMKRPRPKL